MDRDAASGGGIGFCGALTILFIGLKLTGFISWPWVWVLSPVWIPIMLVIVALGLVVILGGVIFGVLAIVDILKR